MSHTLKPLFTWRAAIADKESGLTPTWRHVALTLSLHMSERGDSCFPSIVTLCDETGLSKRAVIDALRALADAGWIKVRKRNGGLGGRGHVPFFFKQWGGRKPKANGRELDGRTWDEMPTDRRSSEQPDGAMTNGEEGT